ncbi:potassium channel family protein [Geobacter grbiciae]|uniref:potassium channel family protein n=1 Tax=Geobacter grbiciae TaxID=155042 RepID=UPI001C02414F|nr:TrkA family potassium uptake protein [Geobacter grbiciae]MBT1073994.1 TrkA family potassium uptake protein [Geobacter grbiciae]
MAEPRFVIIGLGTVGRPLITMLTRDIPLVCIDQAAEALEAARQICGEAATLIQGDATSRLMLERAQIGEADTIVICTTSEQVNIEVARLLAEHFVVQRVIALGITQKGIAELESYGAEVESIFTVSAIGLRNRLELKTKAVHGIGIGKNEILEVEVHPFSRLVNKPLASLRPQRWRVGIIYREGQIVVPTGDVALRPHDKVIILGDPQAINTIAQMLTFRFEAFPREYGDALYVYLEGTEGDRYFEEVVYILDTFPLHQLLIFHPPEAASRAEQLRMRVEERCSEPPIVETTSLLPSIAMGEIMKRHSTRPALVMLAPPRPGGVLFSFISERSEKLMMMELSRIAGAPLLLARGTFPYQKVAVPCFDDPGLQQALGTALEISSSVNFEITTLFATLSPYIATDEEMREFEMMKKTVPDLALLFKKNVAINQLDGNPISAFRDALDSYDMTVASIGSWRLENFFRRVFRPDVCWHTVKRAPTTTLLIPSAQSAI